MEGAAATQAAAAAAAAAAAEQVSPQQPQEGGDVEIGDEDLDRMMGERVSFEPEVETFLRQLYDKVYIRCIESIRRLYEVDFPTLCDRFYAGCPWPSVETVADFYHQYQRYHSLIMTLYTELYYRHLFLKCPEMVTWEHRRDSWNNYALLVEFLADTSCSKDRGMMTLPSQWVWDMLEEFCYQFQECCKAKQKKWKYVHEHPDYPRVIQELESDQEIWPAFRVFELLQKIVQQSEVKLLLQQQKTDPAAAKGMETDLGFQLGYFALILQLRLQVQVGLFYSGVSAVDQIEVSTKSFYWRVPSAHVCFIFHLGFAYMMLRRYQDAIRVISQSLISLLRQKGQLTAAAGHQNATINRAIDRMHVLLLLCSKLSGTRLDDSIHQNIKEKYSDKYYKLQQETDEPYCELFTWAAPRFIDPASPPLYEEEAFRLFVTGRTEIRLRICKLFLKEVESRRRVNTINSFTKLYHNIPLAKLGRLLSESVGASESSVRCCLMAAKLRSPQLAWRQGALLPAETLPPNADAAVDFKIDGDMVHVKNQQTQRVYVDYFVKQIEKTESLIIAAQNAVVPPAPQQQQQQQQQQQEQQQQHDSPGMNRDRRNLQTVY